jgi:hypothetical protein
MKTRLTRDARLLVLFAVLAALPLAIWACSDAGDGPGGPTGPSSKYNPNIDYPGATITTRAEPSSVAAPGVVTILAFFKDANGLPVEGVPLTIVAEGGASAFFTVQTNPTLTGPNGGASINITVLAECPTGSYGFLIRTQRAWSAEGHVGFEVTGGGGGGGVTVTSVAIVADQPSVTAGADAFFTITAVAPSGCTAEVQYNAVGAGLLTGWFPLVADGLLPPGQYSVGTISAGTLTVQARATCVENEGAWTNAPAAATITVN